MSRTKGGVVTHRRHKKVLDAAKGYYDHRRRWHSWRSHDEWRHFRRHYRSRYHDYDHDWRRDRHDRGRHGGHRRNRGWDG